MTSSTTKQSSSAARTELLRYARNDERGALPLTPISAIISRLSQGGQHDHRRQMARRLCCCRRAHNLRADAGPAEPQGNETRRSFRHQNGGRPLHRRIQAGRDDRAPHPSRRRSVFGARGRDGGNRRRQADRAQNRLRLDQHARRATRRLQGRRRQAAQACDRAHRRQGHPALRRTAEIVFTFSNDRSSPRRWGPIGLAISVSFEAGFPPSLFVGVSGRSSYRAAAGPTGAGGRGGGPPSRSWFVCRGRAGVALGEGLGAPAAPLGTEPAAGFFGSALLASLLLASVLLASPLFASALLVSGLFPSLLLVSVLFVSVLPLPPDGGGEAAGGAADAPPLVISLRGQEKSSARPCGAAKASPRLNTRIASGSGSFFCGAPLVAPR